MSSTNKLMRLEPIASPIGDLIASVGRGVAEAQRALDIAALETIDQIYEGSGETAEALRDIGYRPTWYQIPEVSAELKVAMRVEGEKARQPAPGPAISSPRPFLQRPKVMAHATPVDATYSNRFDYEVEASSKITFKVVPVPPPSSVEDRMEADDTP
jgi:hypothetical protein